jgi:hypothetical protein
MAMLLVGDAAYLMIFKEFPYGIKLTSQEYVSAMIFIFENMKIE